MKPEPPAKREREPRRRRWRVVAVCAFVLVAAALASPPLLSAQLGSGSSRRWETAPGFSDDAVPTERWDRVPVFNDNAVPTGRWDRVPVFNDASVPTGWWDRVPVFNDASVPTGWWDRVPVFNDDSVPTGRWDTFTPPQIPDGPITDLWLDEGGRALWVASEGGLGRYDGHAWATVPNPGGLPLRVQALSGDRGGGLWVGSDDGLGHLSVDGDWSWLRQEDGLPHNQVTALAQDTQTGLWVGTLWGVARVVDEPDRTVVAVTTTQRLVRDLVAATDGGIWFTLGNTVTRILPDGMVVERYGEGQGLAAGVQALAATPDGALWIGTESGLFRLSGPLDDRQLQPIAIETEGDGEPPDILALVLDRAGSLWLGTTSGLWHVDASGHTLDGSPLRAAEDRLVANRVQAIARMADGTLWLGTNRGLNRWNPQAWRDVSGDGEGRHPLAAQGKQLWAITAEDLQVWDEDGWRTVVDGPWPDPQAHVHWFSNLFLNVSPQRYGSASARLVQAIYGWAVDGYESITLDGNGGRLWLGTDLGAVFLSDDRTCTYTAADGLPDDRVLTLHAEANEVWIGTDLGLGVGRSGVGPGCDGLWRWAAVPLPTGGPSASVRDIDRGSDGSLWVASEEGLWRLPAGAAADVSGNWRHYTSADGLLSTRTNALWTDEGGALWVGTASGLNGLDDNGTLTREDDLWVPVTAADGLVYNRVTALWRDVAGVLWVETGRGGTALVRHVPTSISPALSVPEDRSRPNWWRLEVGAQFHGDSLAARELVYRYRLPGQPWVRTTESGWVDAAWTPAAGDTFGVHVVDADLNRARLDAVTLDIPLWQRPWGWWWVRLLVYAALSTIAVALTAQKPIGRWWRDMHRASYREAWEISFLQDRPEQETCTIFAYQTLTKDLRLRVEQIRGRRPLQPPRPIRERQTVSSSLSERHRAWRENPYEPALLDDLAAALSGVLLTGRLGQHLRANLALPGHRIRLRLNFADAPALAAYPWEVAGPPLMGHLGLDPATALSRWLAEDQSSSAGEPDDQLPSLEPLDRDGSLRLLLVAAAPDIAPKYREKFALPPLEIRQEIERIRAVFQEQASTVDLLPRRHRMLRRFRRVSQQQAVTIDLLLGTKAAQLLGANKPQEPQEREPHLAEKLWNRLKDASSAPDVVHFIGHAGPRPGRPEEHVLYMESNIGQFMPLGGAELAKMILTAQKKTRRPKALVLNACRTAAFDGGRTLAGLAPLLLTQTRLMAIVGTQYDIGDEGSARFSANFYRELIKTEPLDYAISQARRALKDQLGGRDWAAPVLYMRVDNGMLYER
jgi:ligand-binding sensor domain-containing protein